MAVLVLAVIAVLLIAGHSSAARIDMTTGSLGTYLVDGQGRTVYLFQADRPNSSTCYGGCARAWPPVLTSGTPTAGPGVDPTKLETTTRSDGNVQVTYNRRPLYYFGAVTKPGNTDGQGLNQFGGLWFVVSPAGNAITRGATGTSPAPRTPTTTPTPPRTTTTGERTSPTGTTTTMTTHPTTPTVPSHGPSP